MTTPNKICRLWDSGAGFPPDVFASPAIGNGKVTWHVMLLLVNELSCNRKTVAAYGY